MANAQISTKNGSIASTYLKRTMGLIKEASVDYVKEAMPVTASTASSIKNTIKPFASSISNISGSVITKTRQLNIQQGMRKINDWFLGMDNSFSGSSVDSDLDFDIDTIDDPTAEMDMAQLSAEEKSSLQISKTVVETSHKMVEAQLSVTANILTSMDKLGAAVISGFDNTNAVLEKLLEVTTKNTSTLIEATVASASNNQNNQMMTSGKFDFKAYQKIIGENFNKSEYGMIAAFLPMLSSEMRGSMLSPEELSKYGLSKLLNKVAPSLKKNMKVLDESVNSLIMGSLIRLGEQRDKPGFLGQIGKIFGINGDRKEISTERSSIGIKAIPFDTVTKEAVTNAIPGYLRQILIQLGGPDQVYDYRSRSFKSKRAIQSEFRQQAASTNTFVDASNAVRTAMTKNDTNTDDEHYENYNNFRNMVYDLMMEDMSWSIRYADDVLKSFTSKSAAKKYIEKLIKGSKIPRGNGKAVEQLALILSNLDDRAKSEIKQQVVTLNMQRTSRLGKYISDADDHNMDLSSFSDSPTENTNEILRQYTGGKNASSISNVQGESNTPLVGTDYTNSALFEIYRRLNKGINVFQVGSSNTQTKRFKGLGKLKQPSWYKTDNDTPEEQHNSPIVSSLTGAEDHTNILTDETQENTDGTPLNRGQKFGKWASASGKNLMSALFNGNPEAVRRAFGQMVGDVSEVAAKPIRAYLMGDPTTGKQGLFPKINDSFGNVTGYLKHKFMGNEYEYTNGEGKIIKVSADKDKSIIGTMSGKINDVFTTGKDKGGAWLKDVMGYFNYGKTKDADGNDNTVEQKRKKMIGASAGALAGLGFLGGPLGLVAGSLAGTALSVSGMDGKLSKFLFGEKDKDGNQTKKGLVGKIFDPVSKVVGKVFSGTGNILKKHVLGPISDIGYAIHEGVMGAVYDSVIAPIGRTIKSGAQLVLAPFKMAGKAIGTGFKSVGLLIGKPILGLVGTAGTVLFGGKDKDGKKVPGLIPTVFNNTLGTLFKQVTKTASNILGTVSDRILNPISDIMFVVKEKFKKKSHDFILGAKDKDGTYSGGILSPIVNGVQGATSFITNNIKKVFSGFTSGLGSVLKMAISSPFALIRALNPFNYTEEGRANIKKSWHDNMDQSKGFFGKLNGLAGVVSSFGTDPSKRKMGSTVAEYMAIGDDSISNKLQSRIDARQRARDGRDKLSSISEGIKSRRAARKAPPEDQTADNTANLAESNEEILESTRNVQSDISTLTYHATHHDPITDSSLYTSDIGLHERIDNIFEFFKDYFSSDKDKSDKEESNVSPVISSISSSNTDNNNEESNKNTIAKTNDNVIPLNTLKRNDADSEKSTVKQSTSSISTLTTNNKNEDPKIAVKTNDNVIPFNTIRKYKSTKEESTNSPNISTINNSIPDDSHEDSNALLGASIGVSTLNGLSRDDNKDLESMANESNSNKPNKKSMLSHFKNLLKRNSEESEERSSISGEDGKKSSGGLLDGVKGILSTVGSILPGWAGPLAALALSTMIPGLKTFLWGDGKTKGAVASLLGALADAAPSIGKLIGGGIKGLVTGIFDKNGDGKVTEKEAVKSSADINTGIKDNITDPLLHHAKIAGVKVTGSTDPAALYGTLNNGKRIVNTVSSLAPGAKTLSKVPIFKNVAKPAQFVNGLVKAPSTIKTAVKTTIDTAKSVKRFGLKTTMSFAKTAAEDTAKQAAQVAAKKAGEKVATTTTASVAKTAIKTGWNGIKVGLEGTIKFLGTILGFILDGLLMLLQGNQVYGKDKYTADAAQQIGLVVGGAIGGTGGGFADGFQWADLIDIGGNALKWMGLGAAAGSAVPILGNGIGAIIGFILGLIFGCIGGKTMARGIGNLLEKVGNLMHKKSGKGYGEPTGHGPFDWVEDAASWVGEKVVDGVKFIGGVSESVWNTIKQAASSVVSFVGTLAGKGLDIFNLIKGFKLSSGLNGLLELIGKIGSVVSGKGFGNVQISQRNIYGIQPSKSSIHNDPEPTGHGDQNIYYQGNYGTDMNMNKSGCGPIAASYLSNAYGKNVSPMQAANMLSRTKYRDSDGGTTSAGVAAIGDSLGLPMQTGPVDARSITDKLLNGEPVALLGKSKDPNSPYTKSGHFVVADGIDSAGNVSVMNPLSKSKKKYSARNLLNGVESATFAKGYGTGGDDNSTPTPTYSANPSSITTKNNSFINFSNSKRSFAKGFGAKLNKRAAENASSKTQAEMIKNVITEASNWIGYLEKNSNMNLESKSDNAGSGNYTIFAKYYKDFFGTDLQGQYWCAMFVSTIFRRALGEKIQPQVLQAYASCAAGAQWFQSKGALYKSNPEPGDVIFYQQGGKICHTGIVSSVDATYVHTIEGNTSGSSGLVPNGGAVATKKHALSSSYIYAYGRPLWNVIDPNATIPSIQSLPDGASLSSSPTSDTSSADYDQSSALGQAFSIISGASGKALGVMGINIAGASQSDSTSSTGSTDVNGSDTATKLTGTTNMKKAYNFLISKGLSPAAASGIIGNLQQESGIDPTKLQHGGGAGRGIGQWGGGRYNNLVDLATKKGTKWDDLGTQLDFLWSELQSSDIDNRMKGKTSPQILSRLGIQGIPDGVAGFSKLSDVNYATALFEGAFERAGKQSMKNRYSYANQAYKLLASNSTAAGKGYGDSDDIFKGSSDNTAKINYNVSNAPMKTKKVTAKDYGDLSVENDDKSKTTLNNTAKINYDIAKIPPDDAMKTKKVTAKGYGQTKTDSSYNVRPLNAKTVSSDVNNESKQESVSASSVGSKESTQRLETLLSSALVELRSINKNTGNSTDELKEISKLAVGGNTGQTPHKNRSRGPMPSTNSTNVSSVMSIVKPI